MEINISKYAGFCDGVNRAYEIVKNLTKDKQAKRPIYVLGSLVHNDDVVQKIKEFGVEKIDFSGEIGAVENVIGNMNIGTLIITAHGIGPKIFEIAEKKNIDVVDTTCPKVIKAQRLAEVAWRRKYQIIIIGKNKHKETMGILRWARKKAIVVEKKSDVSKIDIADGMSVAIISQTTQNQDRVEKIIDLLLRKFPAAEVLDTVCSTTKNRQEEVKRLAETNDVILVIGSPSSSNSTELWNIAKQNNSRSYFIERAEQIDSVWLENCQSVGVTAGASSPKWIINEVIRKIEKG